MEKKYSDLSAYSRTFGLELSLRNEWKSVKIGDLTTNPIGNKNRSSDVIGINGIIAPSSELFFQIYPEILKSAEKLHLILAGGSRIELVRLGVGQKFKDMMIGSALLPFVAKYPEGQPLVLTNEILAQQGIRRGLEYDSNGYKLGPGKYTKAYTQGRYFNK